MARTARAEGFPDLAAKFEDAAQAERAREVRFQKLLENHREGRVFRKEAPALRHCRNCGRLEWGKRAPASCPLCGRPQDFSSSGRKIIDVAPPEGIKIEELWEKFFDGRTVHFRKFCGPIPVFRQNDIYSPEKIV